MVRPVELQPPKQTVDSATEDPHAHFPLTRDNVRLNLPRVLRQMLSYDLIHLNHYEALTRSLYAPDAQFHYPAAALYGRDAICAFWNSFLMGEVTFQRVGAVFRGWGLSLNAKRTAQDNQMCQ